MNIYQYLILVFSLSIFSIADAKDVSKSETKKPVKTGFFFGALSSYNNEIYKGHKDDFLALPVIGYRGEKFNFLGPLISYSLIEKDNIVFNTLIMYRTAGYDESDSSFFTGMKDRKSTLDAGVSIRYKKQAWSASSRLLQDTLGRSNGAEVKSSLGKTFYFGPIFIEPNIGFIYWNHQYVDYYYGVGKSEASSNRGEYRGSSSINKKLGVNVSTPIFLKGFTRLSIEQVWYDSAIQNSPLTDSATNISIRLTFSRFF